eukprot:763252-Hanusia_phi.AAC.6
MTGGGHSCVCGAGGALSICSRVLLRLHDRAASRHGCPGAALPHGPADRRVHGQEAQQPQPHPPGKQTWRDLPDSLTSACQGFEKTQLDCDHVVFAPTHLEGNVELAEASGLEIDSKVSCLPQRELANEVCAVQGGDGQL